MADTLVHQASTDEVEVEDQNSTPTEGSDHPDTDSGSTPPAEGDGSEQPDESEPDEDTPVADEGDSADEGDDEEESTSDDLESMTADRDRWKSFSRQWEARAKDSQSKVQEAQETIQKQAEELQSLHSANLRREVAAEFQVPENLLHGDDRDQMVQVAKDLSAWSQTSVRPRTSLIPTPASGRGQASTASSGGRQAAADALRRLRSSN